MKITLDTDTRQMRRRADGNYTTGVGKMPCDHCALNTECVHLPRRECPVLRPAFPFTDETGLDRIANTMRVGRAWTERLMIGQIVGLYNTKASELFGHAKVLYVSCGPIVKMLQSHAHANHLMLDTPPNEAPAKLGAWMRQNYGPRIITDRTSLTAIFLLRIHGEVPPADFQRLEEDGAG